jgi:hypothetical protein
MEGFVPRVRDDDESSVASMATTFSDVSVNPSLHAQQRAVQRQILDSEVQQAKAQGRISLAIQCSDEDTTVRLDEGAQLVEGGALGAADPRQLWESSR